MKNKRGVRSTATFKLSFRSIVALVLLFLTGPIHAAGTLSGTITDAVSGTPIEFVDVDVLDPVTGEDPPGLKATTNAAGYYEIADLPPGDYKLMFNAVDSSNAYGDELYDGIACNNGNCDRDVLVTMRMENSRGSKWMCLSNSIVQTEKSAHEVVHFI